MAVRHQAVTLMRALIKDAPPRYQTALPSLRRAFSQSSGSLNVPEGHIRRMFRNWCKKFERTYDSVKERRHRLGIFKQKYLLIREHNAAQKSYTLGLNNFSDLTYQEFADGYLMPPDHVLKQMLTYRNRYGAVPSRQLLRELADRYCMPLDQVLKQLLKYRKKYGALATKLLFRSLPSSRHGREDVRDSIDGRRKRSRERASKAPNKKSVWCRIMGRSGKKSV